MGDSTHTLNIDPDNLVSDFGTLRLSALHHAASISPNVTEVTIGPRSKFSSTYTQKMDTGKTSRISPIRFIQPTKRTSDKRTDAAKTAEFQMTPLTDYNQIRNESILKSIEKARQEKTKRSLLERYAISESKTLQIEQENKKKVDELNAWRRVEYFQERQRLLDDIENENSSMRKEEEIRMEAARKEAAEKQQRANELKREHEAKEKFLLAITESQNKFTQHHQRYVDMIQSTPSEERSHYSGMNQQVIDAVSRFNKIIQNLKKFQISSNELVAMCELTNEMEKLCTELEKILKKKADSAAAAQEAAIAAQKLAEEQKLAAEAEKKLLANKPVPDTVDSAPTVPSGGSASVQPAQNGSESKNVTQAGQSSKNPLSKLISPDRLRSYDEIHRLYQQYTEAIKPLQGDETMKTYRFNCQKAVNTPVNAISAVSPEHLWDKHDKLDGLLSRNPLRFNEVEHQLGKPYCLLLLAKKFVGQGETTVSSNPQAAFPTAAILVSLWRKHPELGKMFQEYLFKSCPFLVPYIQLQTPGQSNEDYCKALGYKFTDVVMENQSMYLKRMAGVARLYFAVMITPLRRGHNDSHPHAIENAWMWLTSILNIDPFPEICATLILECLQVAGWDLWRSYGKQFVKLLNVIQNQYLIKLKQVDEGGPRARLEVLISKITKENKLDPPEGMLPPHFF